MKFQLLFLTKISTNEEVSCFKSLRCCMYHANKCWNAGILIFTIRINFVLSWVEHGTSFITSGPGPIGGMGVVALYYIVLSRLSKMLVVCSISRPYISEYFTAENTYQVYLNIDQIFTTVWKETLGVMKLKYIPYEQNQSLCNDQRRIPGCQVYILQCFGYIFSHLVVLVYLSISLTRDLQLYWVVTVMLLIWKLKWTQ